MYTSIEFGAGKGRFGDKFFPRCLETDIDYSNRIKLDIDAFMNAHSAACPDNQFSKVLLCNPYPYGFVREEGTKLLQELLRIMKPTGCVVLIGSTHNPKCEPSRVQKAADALRAATGTELLVRVTRIHANNRYPKHTFHRLDGSVTIPNVEIILTLKGRD